MGANSLPRRIIKRVARPLLDENHYSYLQCVAKAWDIWRCSWYEPEIEVARAAVSRGDTVLDVGANFGLYAYHLSKAVGPVGRVYAFEPVPFTYKTLRRVVRVLRLDNVEIVPKGCAERNERITFSIPLAPAGTLSAGMAFIAGRTHDGPGKETQVRWTATREVEAEVVRLDDHLPALDDVSFLKCDVEGAETFVFRGATKLLDRHRPTLVIEINPFYLRGFGLALADLLDPLFDLGYSLYRYDETRKKLLSVAPPDVVEDNYVLVHPRRRERISALLPS
jgi:FkbM family methyltransferase